MKNQPRNFRFVLNAIATFGLFDGIKVARHKGWGELPRAATNTNHPNSVATAAARAQAILSSDERALLLSGIGWSHKAELEANVKPGTATWESLSDEALIEVAFISAWAMSHFPDDEYLAALQLLASKPDVIGHLLDVDPFGVESLPEDIREWISTRGLAPESDAAVAFERICTIWHHKMEEIESANSPLSLSAPAYAPEASEPDDSEVAEWVGLHYGVNYDACSDEQKVDWQSRYVEMHAEEQGERP